VIRAMAAGIAGEAPRHLVSYHPRKAAPQSAEWFHQDGWLAFNSIQDWPEAQVGHIAQDWSRAPVKPTWLFEGRYEGYWRNNYKAGDWGEWQVRQQAYHTVLNGSFGHTYGHERVFGFGKDSADWREFLDTPGARSMTHLAKVINGFSPEQMTNRMPAPELLHGGPGRIERLTSDRISAWRTVSGRQATFYSPAGAPIRVRLDQLADGRMLVWWFNPRAGKWHLDGEESARQAGRGFKGLGAFAHEIPTGAGASAREFVPPTRGEGLDWVLILSAGDGI
jgi:hypothetical protein